ncbi:MAG: translesion error-prone DNA polymerase V autoproteolytic subunit [Bacteroidales bacterium]|nr:translesion error-prone DNA polymerase V autoproteolytic subunit [Bacteroidales bacterium]
MEEYSKLSTIAADDIDTSNFATESYNPNALHAGFPSPAQNYMNGTIDLNRVLVRHRETTFFARVEGDTMKDAGIGNGDIVVIDKSLDAKDGDIVVAHLDGEFVLRRLQIDKKQKCAWLLPADSKSKPTKITDGNDLVIWGVVTYTIKKIR